MKKLLFLIVILVLCCSKNNESAIMLSKIVKKNNIVELNVLNNTSKNYYIISPQLEIYKNMRPNINTEHSYEQPSKIDSLICKVYSEMCESFLKDKIIYNHYIIKLPKKSSTKIVYQYNENFDDRDVKYSFLLGYNLDKYSTEKQKNKLLNLKRLMDQNELVPGYELYIEEIKLGSKLLNKFYH